MIGGKGGLSIKDYPFAFSIAALFFPQILQSENSLATLLIITLIGGMLGSLLTIINPFGLSIREIYWRTKQNSIYPALNGENNFVRQILKKNFRAALSSPSISFETDKIVGMMYFIIVLGFAIFRTTQQDFIVSLNLADEALWGIRLGAAVGFASVFVAIHYAIRGFIIRKSKKTISHLDRIRTATISNLAVDFANLSNEGMRWTRYITDRPELRNIICSEFVRAHKKFPLPYVRDLFVDKFDFSKIRREFDRIGYSWEKTRPDWLYLAHRSALEITQRYDADFAETILWFKDLNFLNPTEFDEPIAQLQDSIESRDWYNATLKTYRITDRLEDFLDIKNMPERWKR